VFVRPGIELESREKVDTQAHAIYQIFYMLIFRYDAPFRLYTRLTFSEGEDA
jgi:hypothetical protein